MDERLTNIKYWWEECKEIGNKEVNYLILQAEKKEDLQERFDILSSHHDEALAKLQKLEVETQKLKEYRNTARYHADLNEFLQQRHKEIPIKKFLGRHVVDGAMEYIQQLEKENQRYKEILEEALDYGKSPKILTEPNRICKILDKALKGDFR